MGFLTNRLKTPVTRVLYTAHNVTHPPTKNEFLNPLKMHYEYTTYTSDSTTSLQYYTLNQNCITWLHKKYTVHITPNGKNHNIYGPAITYYSSDDTTVYIRYYINNQLHNEHNPAVIYYRPNGKISQISYYINGKLHNENGPAVIDYRPNGTISQTSYYINNQLHNEQGPAMISHHPNGTISHVEYWKDGIAVDKL